MKQGERTQQSSMNTGGMERHSLCFLGIQLSPAALRTSKSHRGVVSTRCVAEVSPPLPPKHWRIPVIGFLIESLLNSSTNVDLAARYGDVYRTDIFGVEATVVAHPDLITSVMRHPETFTSNGAFPSSFARLLGEGAVFNIDGAEHAAIRSTLLPAFGPGLFPYYFTPILARVRKHLLDFEVSMRNDASKQKKSMALEPVFQKLYFDCITFLTAGLNADADPEKFEQTRQDFLSLTKGLFALPVPFGAWKQALGARNRLDSTLAAQIEERLRVQDELIMRIRGYENKMAMQAKKEIRDGSVDMFTMFLASSNLRAGQEDTPARSRELNSWIEVIINIWFAGYETAASTTSSSVLELLQNDQIYELLLQEQRSLAEQGELSPQQIESGMPLLDGYISEILRTKTAAPTMFRKVKHDTELGGYFVPKGGAIAMDLDAAMKNPIFYPEPDKLDVTRYMKSGKGSSVPKLLSFGATGSPHYCIGAALARFMVKTTLATLLREYETTLDENQSRKYRAFPSVAPKDRVLLNKFKRRALREAHGANVSQSPLETRS